MSGNTAKNGLKTIIIILLIVVLVIVVVNPMMRQEVSFTGLTTAQTISFGSEEILVSETRGQYNPCVYEDNLVFTDYRDGNANIYGIHLSTGDQFTISNTIYPEQLFGISGDYVAYRIQGSDGYYSPMIYRFTNSSRWCVSGNTSYQDVKGCIDGNYYAYAGYPQGSSYVDLWYYNILDSTEYTVKPATFHENTGMHYPFVYGDKMAIYRQHTTGVYYYNITTDVLRSIDDNSITSIGWTEAVGCNDYYVAYTVPEVVGGYEIQNFTSNCILYDITTGNSDIIHTENSTGNTSADLPIAYIPTHMTDDYVLYSKFPNWSYPYNTDAYCMGLAVYDIANDVFSDIPIEHDYIGFIATIDGDFVYYSAGDVQDENDIYRMEITGIITPEPEQQPDGKGSQIAETITQYWWVIAITIGIVAVALIVEWKMYGLKHLDVFKQRINVIGVLVSIIIIAILIWLII